MTRSAEPEIGGTSTKVMFTLVQAERGRLLYANHCANCHGAELQGGAGTALSGAAFALRWQDHPVRDLDALISKQMPLDAPGSMQSDESFATLAFILSKNGYAPRNAPLGPATLFATLFKNTAAESANAPVSNVSVPQLPAVPQYFARPSTTSPTAAELLNATGADWLMYNRDYRSQRFSPLKAINNGNAHRIVPVCAFQLGQVGWYQPSPVVYAGILYVTSGNSTFAIDARTCKKIWQHDYVSIEAPLIVVNRGVTLYNGAVYRTTPTGHLIALDCQTGKFLWDVWVSSTAQGHWLSAAPLIFHNKVFLGEAGGDFGVNAHLYAFDAGTGQRVWTFNLIPSGTEEGARTWKKGALNGGGSTWSSYSIDPLDGLFYAPIGNPSPDYRGEDRGGANLYTDSVVALNSNTGKLAWYAQQLAHDVHDWDTAATPVLYDIDGRDYMAVANKGGWVYIYDRITHKLIAQREVSAHVNAETPLSPSGVHVCPGNVGGVQWNGPAYSPEDRSLYVNSVDWCGTYTSFSENTDHVTGGLFLGGDFTPDPRETAKGWIRRLDAVSGEQIWQHDTDTPMVAGITPTAGGILLTGDLNGDFMVLNSATGDILYRFNTGGAIAGGISTYEVAGKQYIAAASGNSSRTTWGTTGAAMVFVFALPDT